MNTSTKYNKVLAVIATGKGVREALAEVGMSPGSYYGYRDKMKASGKPKKHIKAKLQVQTIPMVAIDTEKLFMVYGTPSMLANFARGLQ